MSILAYYFASQLLGEDGWPRKLGRFKGEGYDACDGRYGFRAVDGLGCWSWSGAARD